MVININGNDIPDPSGLQWDLTDVSSDSSGRNAAGSMLKDLIAQKVKLGLSWNFLTFQDASTILQAIDSIYFNVAYPDPKAGSVTVKTFYVDSRSAPMYSICDGIAGWKSLSLSLVEK